MIGALLGEPVQVLWDEWRLADQRYYVSDTSAFTQLTGWRPQVSIEAGLARITAWLTTIREDLRESLLATAAGQP